MILDTLTSVDGKAHKYEALFHTETINTRMIDNKIVYADLGKTYDICIITLENEEEKIKLFTSQKEPRYYGWYVGRNDKDVHPATTIARCIENKKEYKFKTLIFPIKKGEELPKITNEEEKYIIEFESREYVVDFKELNR